jgi:hypothetical protein
VANKTVYPIGDFRYGTRRLRAGDDPLEMNQRDARLFLALGKISETRPSGIQGGDSLVASVPDRVEPPASKRPRRKRAAKK